MASCTCIWMGCSPMSQVHHRTTVRHDIILTCQPRSLHARSTSTMSGYNKNFDFNAAARTCYMPSSLNDEPITTGDQSGTWNAASHPSSGLMEGDTAAQLHAPVDFAPFEGARSNG